MKNFEHVDAATVEEAVAYLSQDGSTRAIAGGTDLLILMKSNIVSPKRLVNLKTITNLNHIAFENGALRLGALTTLSEIRRNDQIGEEFAVLKQAVGQAASPQLRHMGTIAGNLLQRPRCWYFRGPYFCRRKGGDRCYAVGAQNRNLAILGGDPCFIVHPSDTAPALVSLNASLRMVGPRAERIVPLADFFLKPKDDVQRENILQSDEVILEVQIPRPADGSRGVYLKAMERKAWSFALASVAAQVVFRDAIVSESRIVLGGVAPEPWRAKEAERVLQGRAMTSELAGQAGEAAVTAAQPMEQNGYKISLTRELVKRALLLLSSADSRM